MQVITNTAKERKLLADFCTRFNWSYEATETHLHDAMPETLLFRLGRVAYEIKPK